MGTESTKRFGHLKAGDTVLVVPQTPRHGTALDPYQTTITRVGRKYAYVMCRRYDAESPFHLNTGESAHKEGNERANGFGFDVWESFETYQRAMAERENFKRLTERLLDDRSYSRRLKDFPPQVVQQIHDVLDLWEAKGGAS